MKFRVGTFVHERGEGRAALILCYLRDYLPSWDGCVEYDVDVGSSREAKAVAKHMRRQGSPSNVERAKESAA